METVAVISKPSPSSHAPPHLPPPEIQTLLSPFQTSEFIYERLRLVEQLKKKKQKNLWVRKNWSRHMLPPEANFFRWRLNVSDMPLLGVVMICSIPPGAGFPHPLGYTCPERSQASSPQFVRCGCAAPGVSTTAAQSEPLHTVPVDQVPMDSTMREVKKVC